MMESFLSGMIYSNSDGAATEKLILGDKMSGIIDTANLLAVLVCIIHRMALEEIVPKREFDYEYRLPDVLRPVIYDLKFTFASNSDEIIGQVQLTFIGQHNLRESFRFAWRSNATLGRHQSNSTRTPSSLQFM